MNAVGNDLIKAAEIIAKDTLKLSYSPYSRFAVAACLVSEQGSFYSGVNVENVSFGLTMCAERVAVGNAIARGDSKFLAIVIVADSAEPIVPCGACRQVLAEFSPNLTIHSLTTDGKAARWSLGELLPLPRQGILDRTSDEG